MFLFKETSDSESSTNLMPIGYANNFRVQEDSKLNSLSTSTHKNNRKANKHQNKKTEQQESSIKDISQKRPHQRNNRNQTKLVDKLLQSTTQETTSSYNSPFIIILEDDETLSSEKAKDEHPTESRTTKAHQRPLENSSNSNYLFNFKFLITNLIVTLLINKLK